MPGQQAAGEIGALTGLAGNNHLPILGQFAESQSKFVEGDEHHRELTFDLYHRTLRGSDMDRDFVNPSERTSKARRTVTWKSVSV